MTESVEAFLMKAEESLAGAESEFVNGRYNNCANRCYYACFQAAIAALLRAGIEPAGQLWGHQFVQVRFVGDLINRRKVYPAILRTALANTLALRQTADYKGDRVNQREGAHALAWTRPLVESVQGRGDNQ